MLFTMLDKVILTFYYVDEILNCDYSDKSDWAALPSNDVCIPEKEISDCLPTLKLSNLGKHSIKKQNKTKEKQTNKQTSESSSLVISHGLDWALLSSILVWTGSLTTCPTPPGVGSFLLLGVLCWELVGLFFGLAPPVMSFLAGEGDWVSPERTGMRDWLVVSGAEGLGSS